MDRCNLCDAPLVSEGDVPPMCARCVDRKTAIAEQEKEKTCVWHYEPAEFSGDGVWKTECGREFDRLRGSEQPRKHLAMEYCPFCGGHIIDSTQDC